MSHYLSFLVFLNLVVILCQASSILTPQQHAEELHGDLFCDRDSKTLKKICVNAAKNEKIKGYNSKSLDNLTCKTGDEGKVLLYPDDDDDEEGPQFVQDALLECIFKLPGDNIIPGPYEVNRTFGRGHNRFDAFRYEKRNGNYEATGLYRNLLKGAIPNDDEFCDRSSETLKAICVQAAKNEKIKGYDTKPLKNLSCKKGNNAKVLLDPGNGEAWELVQDALLECIFKMPADQFIPQPYTVDRIFGRGRNKYDAFRYEWSQEKSNYVATGLYKNLLKGLV
ncbi:uncharacterized protein LOC135849164 [Planococcus citri]|uniref:uncharacterized protein LOC135849164 n=1 Tax=Planococcus citri TaxID=170843 RepID=UPI0031F9FF18